MGDEDTLEIDALRCRYADCGNRHPLARNHEQITCPVCRNDMGLPELPGPKVDAFRLLDLNVFNNAVPYRLKDRLVKAAFEYGLVVLSGAWLRLTNLEQAERVARRVMADFEISSPGVAPFQLSGATLWSMCNEVAMEGCP